MSKETNAIPIEDRPLTPQQASWRWKILFSTYFAYGGFYLCRKAYSICKSSIRDDLHIDYALIGHIWTAFLVAYMIGQLANSFIGRKWGPRVILLGGLGLSMVFNIVFGFANSYWTLLIFMAFNGLVQACGWPGCVGGVAEWIRKKDRGTIMGFWSTNYMIGNIMIKSLGGLLLINMGWHYTFFGCTIATFFIWWLIFFWQRNKPEDVGLDPIVDKSFDEDRTVSASDEVKITFKDYSRILLNPVVPLMGLSYLCLKFLRYAMDSWTPTFLHVLGLRVDKASYWSMIFDFIGLPGAILAGILLDKLFRGKWTILCLSMGVGLVFGYIIVLKYGGNPYAFALCAGLIGFMLYGPDTIINGTAAVQVAGERNAVAVAGLINGMGSLGPIIQEEVIGNVMNKLGEHKGIIFANTLGLWMSIFFVAVMIVITITVYTIQKKNALALQTKI